MRYKILFVHGNSNNIAGQEIALLNTIKGLRRIGMSCFVLLPTGGRFDDLLRENNIITYHIELNRLHKKNPLPYFRTVFSIYRLLKGAKISIVHTSGAYPVQYCLPAARLARIPCVCHIHSTVYSKEAITKSFVRYADYIICASNGVKNMLINYCCKPYKMKTIYYGVIDNEFLKYDVSSESLHKKYNIPLSSKIIGQISQIIPHKGLEYFIKMARKVKDAYRNVKFMVIGNAPKGYEGYENKIKKLVRKTGLDGDVIFTGFQKDVDKFISFLDIFVLSSLVEGLPFVIVESLALRKPIVATAIGGVPEVIINNKTGLLVPTKDPFALAKAVIDLLNNPQKSEELGKNGKKLVLDKFDIDGHAKQLRKLYDFLLNNKKKKILFFEPSSGFGGSANSLSNLINNLNREKFSPVVVIRNYGSQIKKINGAKIIKLKNYYEPKRISFLTFISYFLKYVLPETMKVYLIIKKERIGIVHINTNIIF